MKWLIILSLLFCSCGKNGMKTLKVAATPVPHAEMLEAIKPDLEKLGIKLKIITVTDYNLPNRMLAEKDVDANFFQHSPFLQEQVKLFHYPIMCLIKVHIEPMGLYSKSIHSLAELGKDSLIAIPSDPTNEARALMLLQEHGLIGLKDPRSLTSTIYDIRDNPKNIRFKEVDSAMLARSLSDVSAAVIPTNFALQANLNPLRDAIIKEEDDSPYVNIIAIRNKDSKVEELQALLDLMNSEKMKTFILEHYKGSILPAFGPCGKGP